MGSHSITLAKMGNQGGKEAGLSRADLEFLKTNTRYDEDTIQQWYKGFLADCPLGKLTESTFLKIYSKCFPSGNAIDFCEHVFRTFDTDKNGVVDFREFLLAIDVTSDGIPEEKLNWAFSLYDVDGNGWIDIDEMTTIIRSIYKMMGPNQTGEAEMKAEDVFRKMDSNNDGKLTRQEFVCSCMNDSKLAQLLSPRF